ncbi:VOC family protein [Candidatus Woesearchaeota archaeon]|jgi:uncharacterized protein|nr:VOC family protein [Candidatus Woesearchaeota archaeon]
MNKITHFEIPADNMERAKSFYEQVFDWKINKWEGSVEYWCIKMGQGKDCLSGGLMSRKQGIGKHPINTIEVISIDEFLKKIELKGGEIITPKMTIDKIGFIAYFKDTEGNVMGILEKNKT